MRKVCNRGRLARGFSWSSRRVSGRPPVHAPPFSAARRAMRLDRGGVDGQNHAVLAAAGERFKDRLPMSALGPAVEPIVDRRVRTKVRRAIAPAGAALKHVNDTADDTSIVVARRSGLVRWQMRLYLSPLFVVEPEQSLAHRSPPCRISSLQGNQSALIRYRPSSPLQYWCLSYLIGANPSEGGINANVAKSIPRENTFGLAGSGENARRSSWLVAYRIWCSDLVSKLVVRSLAGRICARQ